MLLFKQVRSMHVDLVKNPVWGFFLPIRFSVLPVYMSLKERIDDLSGSSWPLWMRYRI